MFCVVEKEGKQVNHSFTEIQTFTLEDYTLNLQNEFNTMVGSDW